MKLWGGGGGKNILSKILLSYMESEELLLGNFDKLADGLKKMKADMLFYKVVTMALYPQNILHKKDKNGFGRFVIIDDIGSAAFIPMEYYFSFAARARINRKWQKFTDYLASKYTTPLAQELIKQIR
jgi:hypothetical protein